MSSMCVIVMCVLKREREREKERERDSLLANRGRNQGSLVPEGPSVSLGVLVVVLVIKNVV